MNYCLTIAQKFNSSSIAEFGTSAPLTAIQCYRQFNFKQMQYLFIFTAGIVILNLLKIVTMFGKHTLSLPNYKWLSPTQWWVFYPSFFFQIYWWSVYAGLINCL